MPKKLVKGLGTVAPMNCAGAKKEALLRKDLQKA